MMRKVIVAGNINKESIKTLEKFNVDIFTTSKCDSVYDEISYHTDIQMFIDGRNIIIEPKLYDKYVEELNKENNFIIEKGESFLTDSYPKDIMYNSCIIGKYFIHNLEYTDKKILEYIDKNNYEKINIKQGYSKCSISIVDENSIITSDKGIAKELSKYLDVLYIEPDENIRLGNMAGIIGGATGLIDNNWLINGDINRLKECDKIINFVKQKNKEIVCLNNGEIEDVGSILFIKY